MKKSTRDKIDTVYRKRLFWGLVILNTAIMLTILIIFPFFISDLSFQEIIGNAKLSEFALRTMHLIASFIAMVGMNVIVYHKMIVDQN